MAGGRRGGATNSVQRALGWVEEQGTRRKPIEQPVYCDQCKALLEFDIPDPQMLGRSMERCSNRACPGHKPRPLMRQLFA